MTFTPEYEQQYAAAAEYANKIAKAIESKLGNYEVSARRHDTSDIIFIEFRLHAPNTSDNMDICSAYSVAYLTVAPELRKERAQTILDNIRGLVGKR